MAGGTSFNNIKGQFTKAEERHLVEYLAEYHPDKKGRSGNKIYEHLVENPEEWPWSKSRSWQSWRHFYVKNEASLDLKIKKILKGQGAAGEAREAVDGQLEETPPSQNLQEGSAENGNKKRKVDTNWMNEERDISRTEDLPRQRSKVAPNQVVPYPPKASPRVAQERPSASILVPSSQQGQGEAADLEIENPRSGARIPPAGSPMQVVSSSNERREEGGYHTPPPSRSPSSGDMVTDKIGVEAPRLSDPVAKAKASQGGRGVSGENLLMTTHETLWWEVVNGPNAAERGEDTSRPLHDQAEDVEDEEMETRQQKWSSQPQKESQRTTGTNSSYLEPPPAAQRMRIPSVSTTQPESSSIPSRSQQPRHDSSQHPIQQATEHENQDRSSPPAEEHQDPIDFISAIDLEDTPMGAYSLTQLGHRYPEGEADPTSRKRRVPGLEVMEHELEQFGTVKADRLRMILSDPSPGAAKRKRSSLGKIADGNGEPVSTKEKRLRMDVIDLDMAKRKADTKGKGKGKATEQQLLGIGRANLNSSSGWAPEAAQDHGRAQSAGVTFQKPKVKHTYLGHHRRHTFGGTAPLPNPFPDSLFASPEQPGSDRITSTPVALQRQPVSARGSSGSAEPPVTLAFPPSQIERMSSDPIDLSDVSQQDISWALFATLGSLAKMHHFSVEVVRDVWSKTGDFQRADEMLGEMRSAAQQMMERRLSAGPASRQTSRAVSMSRSHYEQAASHNSVASRGARKSLLSDAQAGSRRSRLSNVYVPDTELEIDEEIPEAGPFRVAQSTGIMSPAIPDVDHQPLYQRRSHHEEPEEEEEADQPSEVKRVLVSFHNSPSKKRAPDILKVKPKVTWTAEEDAIILGANPVELEELAKKKGKSEIRKRTRVLASKFDR